MSLYRKNLDEKIAVLAAAMRHLKDVMNDMVNGPHLEMDASARVVKAAKEVITAQGLLLEVEQAQNDIADEAARIELARD